MKLCRFDLISEPGVARTGIVYGGKVYETDGANPIGVHEWSDARLLAPVGQPSSVRLYPHPSADCFRYLNPGSIVGPHASVLSSVGGRLGCLPCLAAVVAGGGSVVPVSEADGLVLGFSVATVFFQVDPAESDLIALPAAAFDVGLGIGPALTTPDELDDAVEDEANGRRYAIDLALSVDGQSIWSGNTNSLPQTIAEIFGVASLSTRLRQGDLFIIGVAENTPTLDLQSGQQVRLVSERLGTLVTKVT